MKITTIYPNRTITVEENYFKDDWDLTISVGHEEEYGHDYSFYRGLVRNNEEFWFWADDDQTEEIIWVTNNPDHELVEQLNNTQMPKEWKIQMLRSVSEEICYVSQNHTIWERSGNKIANNLGEV